MIYHGFVGDRVVVCRVLGLCVKWEKGASEGK